MNSSADVLFILLGAIMVLAMHGGFAFLEVGTVRKKNQVNALVKILCDFSISTIVYFFVGYVVAYGTDFLVGANTLSENGGYGLVKFFFLLTFAAAIPAIISGGIAERARFYPQLLGQRNHRWCRLSVFRRCDLERKLWLSGLVGDNVWRTDERFCRICCCSWYGWVDCFDGCYVFGTTSRPIQAKRRYRISSPFQYPIPRVGRLDVNRWLVWL